MATIKVLAGDFCKEDGSVTSGGLHLTTLQSGSTKRVKEAILFTCLESVEAASEENVKKVGGTLGWGAVGALALGPAGLLAGLLLGGKKKEVTFVAKFKDGRKLMATTDSGTFTKLQAAVF